MGAVTLTIDPLDDDCSTCGIRCNDGSCGCDPDLCPSAPNREHVWLHVSDWEGDPGVIGGTHNCGYFECGHCGAEREPTEADERERRAAECWA